MLSGCVMGSRPVQGNPGEPSLRKGCVRSNQNDEGMCTDGTECRLYEDLKGQEADQAGSWEGGVRRVGMWAAGGAWRWMGMESLEGSVTL